MTGPGDRVIVISYAQFTPEEARRHRPVIVVLNADNTVRERLTAGDPAAEQVLADWD
jgi:aspartate 1-decarboxylase